MAPTSALNHYVGLDQEEPPSILYVIFVGVLGVITLALAIDSVYKGRPLL